jgi:hypothetical protein
MLLNVLDDIDQGRGQTIIKKEIAKKFAGDVQEKTMNISNGEF